MIISKASFFIFLLNFNFVYSQTDKIKIMYDVDRLPVLYYFNENISEIDSCIYTKYNKENIQVDFNVIYYKGYKSLQTYCDSLCYNNKLDASEDLNELVYYFILFNNSYQINEIRIYKRFYLNYMYDIFIKECLFKTAGNWTNKVDKSEKWHVYFGVFRLK